MHFLPAKSCQVIPYSSSLSNPKLLKTSTIVRTVGRNLGSNSTEKLTYDDLNKSDPTEKKKGKKVAFRGPPLEQEEEQEHDDNNDDDDDTAVGINARDVYVSHAYYRELIAERGLGETSSVETAPEQACVLPEKERSQASIRGD